MRSLTVGTFFAILNKMKTVLSKALLILILTTASTQSAWALTCASVLSNNKITPTSKQLVLKSLLIGNMRFPQVDFGINAGLLSLVLREGILDLNWPITDDDINSMFEAAKRAHLAQGMNVDFSAHEIGSLMRSFLNDMPDRLVSVIDMLSTSLPAENSPLVTFPRPILADQSTTYYTNVFIEFYQLQTDEGKNYLAKLGKTIDSFLWSDEVKTLSKDWRAFIAKGEEFQNLSIRAELRIKFGEKFKKAFNQYLVSKLPELKKATPGSENTLPNNIFYELAF